MPVAIRVSDEWPPVQGTVIVAEAAGIVAIDEPGVDDGRWSFKLTEHGARWLIGTFPQLAQDTLRDMRSGDLAEHEAVVYRGVGLWLYEQTRIAVDMLRRDGVTFADGTLPNMPPLTDPPSYEEIRAAWWLAWEVVQEAGLDLLLDFERPASDLDESHSVR